MQHAKPEAHNPHQIEYFEKRIKHTMVPNDTPYVRSQIRRLLAHAGISREDRILDLGCGMGRYTVPLARMGYQIEGTDLTPQLLNWLEEYAPDLDIPLHCCDIVEPNFEGPYDAVVGFFVLHHIEDLAGTFRSVSKLLKPGGVAIFLEPNPYNVLYYLQIFLWPNISWEGEKGILQMRPSVLHPLLESAGLDVNQVHRFGFFPPFVKNTSLGESLESYLERIPLLRPLLPFQLFSATKPR